MPSGCFSGFQTKHFAFTFLCCHQNANDKICRLLTTFQKLYESGFYVSSSSRAHVACRALNIYCVAFPSQKTKTADLVPKLKTG